MLNWTRPKHLAKKIKFPRNWSFCANFPIFALCFWRPLYLVNWTRPKHLAKKPSEVRELIWARAKILVKKMKFLVFIEHCVLSLFSYGFLTPLASWFLLDKTFIDQTLSRRLFKNVSETKNLPEGRSFWFILPYSARNRNRRLYLSISR